MRRVTALPRIIGPLIFAASPPRGPPSDTSSRSTRAATPPRDYGHDCCYCRCSSSIPSTTPSPPKTRREKTFSPKTRKPADYITTTAGAASARRHKNRINVYCTTQYEKFILLLCTRRATTAASRNLLSVSFIVDSNDIAFIRNTREVILYER